MKAIVVGGCVGGLCAAIALRRGGIEAAVFERAGRLEEIGAGVALAPNALRGLERLGVADAVRARGAASRKGIARTSCGEVLTEADWNGVSIHRADLQATLLEALEPDTVRLGSACTGFDQDPTAVSVRLADGREERGDVLIGADGLHSEIRAQLVGRTKPRYAGTTAWRGVTRFEHESLASVSESWGRGSRFGLQAIGRGRVYWYATKNAPEGSSAPPAERKRELLERFAGWHEPIEAVIEATEEAGILQTDIYDRKPLRRWSEGRVTLLGDAAHPMTPDWGQGAAQAIEDAVVLADCLRREDDVALALRAYEGRRVRRANALVRQSRLLNRIGQLESPLACRVRDGMMKRTPARLRRRQLERIASVLSQRFAGNIGGGW